MKRVPFLIAAVFAPVSLFAQLSPSKFQQLWQQAYAGKDTNGEHVIGLWSFDSENPEADVSGNGHHGKMSGAKINEKGKFGSGLESFPGFPLSTEFHGMRVENSPKLTPAGAFTIEMWVKPHEVKEVYKRIVFLDKKYIPTGHSDYIFSMYSGKDELQMLTMQLGFGQKSVNWHSERFEFTVAKWYHIAFTYDGAGTGEFFINGQIRGSRREDGVGSIMPGKRGLSIGDRMGGNYAGFPGVIDQVRISNGVLEFRPVRIERISDRTVFRRMEKGSKPRLRITNLRREALAKASLNVLTDGVESKPIQMAGLKPGAAKEISIDFDTAMRPGIYKINAKLSVGEGELAYETAEAFQTEIVARPLPDRFPVLMWGSGLKEIDRLKEIGFTHSLGIGADNGSIWQTKKPIRPESEERVREKRLSLDEALSKGFTFSASLSPGSYLRKDEKLHRVDREGKTFVGREDICPLIPGIADYCRNVGISLAQAYGDHPAFGAALLHTEVKGHARPCFHDHDHKAFHKAEGIEIPKLARHPRGVDFRKIKDFPADRVIADDDSLYRYYRWFWKDGMGWNQLNTELNKGLKTAKRDDFWTFYDPAVRVASVFGSGGEVDVISQWTYSYPDPIRIGLATDELLAMSAGAKHKPDVMKMTQIIWYRSQTAPEAKPGKPHPTFQTAWEKEQPDAPFITMPPMQLREAFWTKIARPIKGIMYHGWSSLVPTDNPRDYRYTHPETQRELARLIDTVVEPLGPTLKNIPAVKNDIAFYESFAAQVYARRGTYGWNGGWAGDSYHIAMWAGLQTDVVYDETITTKGLDGYKILFMTDCDVVTKSILEKVKAFQKKGGIIIGDANLTPALKADILIETYKRTGLAHQDKAELQVRATKLRKELADRYTRYLDSSNPEVVPYRRGFVETDYVFLVNDHREYGRYVGHHGRVMENGLPSDSTITLNRKTGFAYDLVAHQPVEIREEKDHLVVDVNLGPGEGRMMMITPTAIDKVKLTAPKKAKRGEKKTITVEVINAAGKTVDAVIPIEIRIEDAEGRVAEQSGYWTAVHGKAVVTIDIAPNDIEGIWQVNVRELASGKVTAANFRVGEIPSDKPDTKLMDKEAGNAVQPKG